jgi:RNAse (barnase) inhibitor barstar
MKRVLLSLVAAAAFTAFAGSGAASAATTLYQQNTYNAFGTNGYASVELDYSGQFNNRDVWAGGLALTTTPGNAAGNFVAWCLDIFTQLDLPEEYNVTPTPFSTTSGTIDSGRIDNVKKLFNTAYSTLALGNSAQSAGFQLALWEILYETTAGPLSLTTGGFNMDDNTSARQFANYFLQHLNDAATAAYQFVFYESTKTGRSQDSQNLVSVIPVPVPAAGLMLGAGLLGLFGLKRMKKRSTAA